MIRNMAHIDIFMCKRLNFTTLFSVWNKKLFAARQLLNLTVKYLEGAELCDLDPLKRVVKTASFPPAVECCHLFYSFSLLLVLCQ